MIRKKLISGILLSFVMVLMAGLSSIVYAADDDLWVGGTKVDSTNAADIPAKNGTRTGKASYNFSTNTLTLDNYSYSGNGHSTETSVGVGIYTNQSSLKIVLNGENSVIVSGNSAGGNYGFSITGDLSIEGTGSLTATGGADAANSIGIFVGQNMTINSGTVSANGQDGIFVLNGLTINGGNITASGSKFGITISKGSASINGGTVIANGNGNGNNNGYGIHAGNGLTISGGKLSATGNKYGISSGNNVMITGGKVSATGNEYGIKSTSGNHVYINGGTVIAAGDSAGISGNVKNQIKGAGWINKEGTGTKNLINVDTGGQDLLNYKKVQFPEELYRATVTVAPKARDLTYTGSAQELVTAGTTDDGTIKYALGVNGTTAPTTGYTSSIPSGTNAGIYYVWYMVDGDEWRRDSIPTCIQVTIAEAKGSYSYASGAQSIWQKQSGGNLSFRIVNSGNDEKTFIKFTGIQVDGKPVDKNKYEAKQGSVIINLKPAYLETLSVGEHKLNVVFEDGNAETTFTIIGAGTNAGNLPQTGDAQNPLLYVVIAFISVAGIGLFRKRME